MQTVKNGRAGKGVPKQIIKNAEYKGNTHLNKIIFDDGYFAFEKTVANSTGTNFIVDKVCAFEITHPGLSGKPDWILFTTEVDSVVKIDKSSFDKKDVLILAQHSMALAINVTTSMGLSDIDEAQKKALEIMKATYKNATTFIETELK